jgi:hypothetical protein
MILTRKRLTADFVNEYGQWNLQSSDKISQTCTEDAQAVAQSNPEAAAWEGKHRRITHFARGNRADIL